MFTLTRRSGALLAAGAMAGAMCVGLTAPATQAAAPATTTDPAKAAAGFFARQYLTPAALAATSSFSAGDIADGVVGVLATGVAGDAAAAGVDWLATNASGYASYTPPGSATVWYSGSLGKLLLAAHATGRSATSFGGVDLVKTLQALECTPGRTGCDTWEAGEYVSPDRNNGYASVAYQSYAILGLEAVGAGADAAAVTFLVNQQCPGGGFQNDLRNPTAAPATCSPDADATTFALQALQSAGQAGAASASLTWLAGQQNTDGSFGAGALPANTNTTAMASLVLRKAGLTVAADKAVQWILGRQVGCAEPGAAGAIGYTTAKVDASTLKATAQAMNAIAGTQLVATSGVGAAPDAPALFCPPAPTTSADPSPTTAVAAALPQEGTQAAANELPRTGFAAWPLIWIAAVLIVGGGAAVALASRRGST